MAKVSPPPKRRPAREPSRSRPDGMITSTPLPDIFNLRPPPPWTQPPRSDDGDTNGSNADTDTPAADSIHDQKMDPADIIVVGIDFGTTYSGVSWAMNRGEKRVRLVTDWRNPKAGYHNPASDKVPTLITPNNRWGFEADDDTAERWFKVMLDPTHDHAKKLSSRLANKTENSDAKDAARRFLHEIWSHAKDKIENHCPNDNEDYHFAIVLTVPAMWSPQAKAITKEIAIQAGLPSNIRIISEPEAAAIAAFHDKAEDGDIFQEGDVFVVCDAGGGTADLITYRVTSTHPLQVDEYVTGAGDLCGAALIDEGFENYVKDMIGKNAYHAIKPEYRRQMVHDFDVQIKRTFDFDTEKDKNTNYSVRLRGVKDDFDKNIVDECIPIDSNGLRSLFDTVCKQIVGLVEIQIKEVEAKGQKVKSVLLVGGFGANRYLRRSIKDAMKNSGRRTLVAQLDRSWSSICRGATHWGLQEVNAGDGTPPTTPTPSQGPTVRGRLARCSYGIRIDPPAHVGNSKRRSEQLRGGQMIWLIKAGQRIENRQRVTQTITLRVANVRWYHLLSTSAAQYKHTVWYCHGGNPPDKFDATSLTRLGELCHEVKKGSLYVLRSLANHSREVEFTIAVEMGSASLEFFITSKDGKTAARCNVNYQGE